MPQFRVKCHTAIKKIIITNAETTPKELLLPEVGKEYTATEKIYQNGKWWYVIPELTEEMAYNPDVFTETALLK